MSIENSLLNNVIRFFGLLAIVFITLRLLDVIAWSWWWVLAPIWVPLFLALFVFGCTVFVLIVSEAIKESKKKSRN